jgi:outer membrane protein assembly factor BamB
MKKQFRHVAGLFWVSVSLALSACQSLPAAVAPAATLAPVDASAQVTSATPAPTVTSPPIHTSSFKTLWAFQTEGPVWGTPTVGDDLVFFGSDDDNLYAVAVENSHLKWKFATQGAVRSQPVIAEGLVYFTSDDGYLYAIDAQDGTQAWRTDIGNFMPRDQRDNLGTSSEPTGYDYLQSSPVVSYDQVYVGSADGNVYALAADTGKINWTFKTGAKVRATPTVDNSTVYIGSWDEFLYALDALTGQMRWKTPMGGEVQTTALIDNDRIYCASRKASVVALDAQTGEMSWEYDYGFNMWVESSPRLVDGILYIGSSGNRVVMGLDSQTGKALTFFFSKAFHWSTPVIADDTLYIGGTCFRHDGDGGLFALKLVDGKVTPVDQYEWLLPVRETLEASGDWSGAASSPVVADGVIYFGGLDGKLYAVSD